MLIGYLTSFFFLEEKKVKGIFKRDENNKSLIMNDIYELVKTLKKRYISFHYCYFCNFRYIFLLFIMF